MRNCGWVLNDLQDVWLGSMVKQRLYLLLGHLCLLTDKWPRGSCYCEVWVCQVELYWHFLLLHSISDFVRYNYNNKDKYEEVTCDWNYEASPVSATGCLTLWYTLFAITLVCFSAFFGVHFVCVSSWHKEDMYLSFSSSYLQFSRCVRPLDSFLLCSVHDDSGCILVCSI